eukprot:238057_1
MSTPFTDRTDLYSLTVQEELRQNDGTFTYKGRYSLINDEQFEEPPTGYKNPMKPLSDKETNLLVYGFIGNNLGIPIDIINFCIIWASENKGNGVIKYYWHLDNWRYVCEINQRIKDAKVPHSINFMDKACDGCCLNDTPKKLTVCNKILFDYIEGCDLYKFITNHRVNITDHHIAIILKQILEWHDGAISKCNILHRHLSVTNMIINTHENIIEK